MLRAYRHYFLLTLLCFLLYLPGAFMLSMPDRDSAYFAQASKQMVETSDYWQVNFQDKPRHLKPPGIYWLEAASVKIFSPHQLNVVWPYRLPQIIGAWLSVLLTFYLAALVFNRKTASYAAILLAVSLGLQFISQLIMTDAVLLLTMVLMQGSLWRIYSLAKQNTTVPKFWPCLMWLGLALGILIKGLTPIVFLITLTGLFIFDRGLSWWRQLRLGYGLLFTLILTCAWLIPLSLHTHSNFIMNMINQDLLPKIQGGQQSHGQPPGFFLLTLPLTFWPGSLFFALAITFAWQNRKLTDYRFLSIWFFSVWLVYECVPTKLPEYLLPIYPAAAILIAAALEASTVILKSKSTRIFFGIYGAAWFIYSLVLAFAFLFVPFYFDQHYLLSGFLLAAFTFILSTFALIYYYQKQFLRSFYCSVILAFSLPLFFSLELPFISKLWLSQNIAETVQSLPQNERHLVLLSPDYQEPSLVFLMGTKQVEFTDLATIKTQILGQKPFLILLNQEHLSTIGAQTQVLASFYGFDMGNGHWQNLYLIKSGN